MSADRTRAPVRSLAVALEGGQAGAVVSSVNGTCDARCSRLIRKCCLASTNSKRICFPRERAITEGWRGEVEGLDLTLTFLRSKRTQAKQAARINTSTQVNLGIPTIAARD